jgi:hypothetical protein
MHLKQRTWTIEESQQNFDELLDAAMVEPQFIVDGKREFVVCLKEHFDAAAAKIPTAETLARMADSGKSVSRFFTNSGKMIKRGD